ncbi:MAG: TOBE domain-containing protein [Rubrobacter sp.]|nr:TOBE domain-containing protein [Rubrobacter sp.]
MEFTLRNGEKVWTRVTRQEAKHLGLKRGKTVHVRMNRSRVFCLSPSAKSAATLLSLL